MFLAMCAVALGTVVLLIFGLPKGLLDSEFVEASGGSMSTGPVRAGDITTWGTGAIYNLSDEAVEVIDIRPVMAEGSDPVTIHFVGTHDDSAPNGVGLGREWPPFGLDGHLVDVDEMTLPPADANGRAGRNAVIISFVLEEPGKVMLVDGVDVDVRGVESERSETVHVGDLLGLCSYSRSISVDDLDVDDCKAQLLRLLPANREGFSWMLED